MKYHDNPRYQDYIETLESINKFSTAERKKTILELEDVALKDNDLLGLAAAYFYYGTYESQVDDNLEESIRYAEKALNYAVECDNAFFVMKINNLLGINYSKKTEYSVGLNHYLKSYYRATQHPEYEYEYVVLNNIGNLFVYLEEYETAVTFVESSYEKYTKQKNRDRSVIAQIIINIIELYSCAKNYEKVHHWTRMKIVNYNANEQRAIDCLQLMNKIIINKDCASTLWLKLRIEEFLELSKLIDNEIYVLRCVLKVFEVAIKKMDEETATKFIEILKKWDDNSQHTSFQFYIYECLVAYDMKFLKNSKINNTMGSYFEISRSTIRSMQNIYSQSLLLEMELEEEKEIHRNVTEEQILLQKKMERDSFTNLYNKVHIEIKITNEIKKSFSSHKQALFVMDVDKFKLVNDTLGHDKGDVILLEVAEILQKCIKDNILVGRYGGDEFILFVNNYKDEEDLVKIANYLCEEARKIQIPIEGMPNITLSIGIVSSKNNLYFDQLFELADKALYECKEKGRDSYILLNK